MYLPEHGVNPDELLALEIPYKGRRKDYVGHNHRSYDPASGSAPVWRELGRRSCVL